MQNTLKANPFLYQLILSYS